MPPRSYYNDPRTTDYLSYAQAFFPEDLEKAANFYEGHRVPFLETVPHLASYVGVSPSLVRQILHKPAYHYRRFNIPKRDGTQREIRTPRTYLKVIQWWIADNILEASSLENCVHGFRRGFSYVTNARAHAGAKHVLNVDIEKFFPSIRSQMVASLFSKFGYCATAVEILTALTTVNGSAPTGAPTSPMIGNIILSDFDEEVSGVAARFGTTYTRYADDLTFSSGEWIEPELLTSVDAIVNRYGFALNSRKTRFMGPGERLEVTGIVINHGIRMPREWRNWARGVLHSALMSRAVSEDLRNTVYGVHGTLLSIDPNKRDPLTKKAAQAVDALRNRTPPSS